ncbi:hypothetical protein [Cerasicoccus fimbriatus]|uniref:hypothetical protein n=1 Tax=Cerasicoccus fimbriatus TaxID=3014554 RepID=UPI0022B5BA28|nr:hypothetical protein [Cerasicoccus sp. TK19100]
MDTSSALGWVRACSESAPIHAWTHGFLRRLKKAPSGVCKTTVAMLPQHNRLCCSNNSGCVEETTVVAFSKHSMLLFEKAPVGFSEKKHGAFAKHSVGKRYFGSVASVGLLFSTDCRDGVFTSNETEVVGASSNSSKGNVPSLNIFTCV